MAAKCDNCFNTGLSGIGMGMYYGVEVLKATPGALLKAAPYAAAGALVGSQLITAVGLGVGAAQGVIYKALDAVSSTLLHKRVDDKSKINEKAATYVKILFFAGTTLLPIAAISYAGYIPGVTDLAAKVTSTAAILVPDFVTRTLVPAYPVEYTALKGLGIAAATLATKHFGGQIATQVRYFKNGMLATEIAAPQSAPVAGVQGAIQGASPPETKSSTAYSLGKRLRLAFGSPKAKDQ